MLQINPTFIFRAAEDSSDDRPVNGAVVDRQHVQLRFSAGAPTAPRRRHSNFSIKKACNLQQRKKSEGTNWLTGACWGLYREGGGVATKSHRDAENPRGRGGRGGTESSGDSDPISDPLRIWFGYPQEVWPIKLSIRDRAHYLVNFCKKSFDCWADIGEWLRQQIFYFYWGSDWFKVADYNHLWGVMI